MYRREFDEEEVKETEVAKAKPDDMPVNYRPSSDTISSISSLEQSSNVEKTKDISQAPTKPPWTPVASDHRYEEKIVEHKDGSILRMERPIDQPADSNHSDYPHYTENYKADGEKQKGFVDRETGYEYKWADAHYSPSKSGERQPAHRTADSIMNDLDEAVKSRETPTASENIDKPPPGWRPPSDMIQTIQGQQDAPAESEWVDRGIQDVAVDKIDTSDMTHVNGPEDFKKVSYDEMAKGFQKLETVVQPGVEKGAGGDDFYKLDQQQGLDYANGYQRVYDAFYGGDAIKLEKDGEDYRVINGAHRLYVAKELGIQTVPARVKERQRK